VKILITGGAGFIGVNVAESFIKKRYEVFIIDNLSRKGSKENLKFLRDKGALIFEQIDIRNGEALIKYFKDSSPFDAILHLAAQVAVTTSINNPKEDFDTNALGTLNLLEVTRKFSPDSIFIYSSTNKVYGSLKDVVISERNNYYELVKPKSGVPENWNLDFYSPYGCSKGAADQYVRDYSRIYGIKTVVCRQSCIYGRHQFGIEDQGWVAWFAIRTILGKPIYIYGNGKQVRDLLFIDDLVDLYEVIIRKIELAKEKIFNIGGGPKNCASLLQVLEIFKKLGCKPAKLIYKDWRPGDQKIYISDICLANEILGWKPKIDIQRGIGNLFDWVRDNKRIINKYVS